MKKLSVSYSAVQSWRACEQQYAYRYIDPCSERADPMDDKLSSRESDHSGHHGEHIRDKRKRIDSEPEDPGSAGLDTVDVSKTTTRSVSPKEAHDLALRENITIAEAYSRLLGADEE